jgi:glycerol uptake facilitator-like aquaporin
MLDSEYDKDKKQAPAELTIKDYIIIFFYEFLGTSMLTLGYNFTNDGAAVAFSLFVGILIANKVSGGMFNPAVSIAVYVSSGKIKTHILLFIITILA